MDGTTLLEIKAEFGALMKRLNYLASIMRVSSARESFISKEYVSIRIDLVSILKQLRPISNELLELMNELPKNIDWLDGKAVGLLNGYAISTETIINKLINGKLVIGAKHNPLNNYSDKVFIVHGHDIEMRDEVKAFIEKIGLVPIILHEQPNKGRTIIEKFVDYSDVGFSIVLLSPDDEAHENETKHLRARQNVIFELGYFIGKIGRDRVVGLYKPSVQIPSDYSGVLYIEYNKMESWKMQLIKELKEVEFNVDANLAFD